MMNSSIENCPINFIVRSLKMPVYHYISTWISISYSIARWYQSSFFPEINSKITIWLIVCSKIGRWSSNKLVNCTIPNTAGKGLNYLCQVWILKFLLSSFSCQIVNDTIFIKIMLILKLCFNFVCWLYFLFRIGISSQWWINFTC